MILADVIVLWVVGVLLIGFVGFFAVVLALFGRALRALGRALLPAGDDDAGESVRGGRQRVCRSPPCGYLNRPDARYCARCGRPLEH
ncbi:MAG: zinc ribbon domain-containing protein, partial [Planctomycetota bacterium]